MPPSAPAAPRLLSLFLALLFFAVPASSDSVFSSLFGWLGRDSPLQEALDDTFGYPTAVPEDRQFILGAGTTKRARQIDYSSIMMHRPEVDLIASYLRPTDVYLEYGSGGSTVNFAPLVGSAFTIEHNCEWADYMRRTLLEHAITNVNLTCAEVPRGSNDWGLVHGFEHGSYRQFHRYINAIDLFEVPKFDRVLIDGRARLAAALKVLPYLKPSSLVFLHDFYTRTHLYAAVLEYYEEVARVLAHPNLDKTMGPLEEPQGLIVLRRRASVTDDLLPLSDALINSKYDAIDYRDGENPPIDLPSSLRFFIMGHISPYHWKRYRTPSALLDLVHADILRILSLAALLATALLLRAALAPLLARARAAREGKGGAA
eukprot:CAMPEP_0174910860 /NCGR_PEP_ID=MMETSP0167-20121228/74331_1 /TAXON_ID=38298 /ORGANISM="Rhodella maculata, Strain CCMP736" /LENGTH=372 /DNA_ID=CAMNT_0016155241 /DNA_START=10 /DNA_END=1124 /DNA_ORIENTATION=-